MLTAVRCLAHGPPLLLSHATVSFIYLTHFFSIKVLIHVSFPQ
ncbi:hypothetical protein PANNVG_03602 [Pantoea sp. Nvir]